MPDQSHDTEMPAAPHGAHAALGSHVLREALTMALYLTISLLAVLAVHPEDHASGLAAAGTIWGTVVGLTLAHVLAFRLVARRCAGASLEQEDLQAMAGQALAAMVVATLASLPSLLGGVPALGLSRTLLAGLVGLFAFGTARRHGAATTRSLVYAVAVVLIAGLVAVAKNVVGGH